MVGHGVVRGVRRRRFYAQPAEIPWLRSYTRPSAASGEGGVGAALADEDVR
jgi:hypothetical protein